MKTPPMIDPVLLSCATNGSEIDVVERAEKDKGGIDPFKTKRTFIVCGEYHINNLKKFLREVGMSLVSRVEIMKIENITYLYMYTSTGKEFIFLVRLK